MRFGDAVARLERMPERLPPAPPELMPVLADGRPRPASSFPDVPARAAAVLVLIVPGPEGEARVVLTERVVGGRHHGGEVSFAGGAAEPGDADAAATALREAAEEIGLDPEAAGLRVIGRLDQVWIPVSGFRITPVLAVAHRYPALYPAEAEVARIIEAPLSAFLPGAEIRIVERTMRDWPIRYGAYPVEDLLIWGATARILGQLGAALAANQATAGSPASAASPDPGQSSRSPVK